jgi:hypothetical protein
MRFDFAELADGIRRNNLGLAGFTLQTTARVQDGRVVIEATGQSFPLRGSPPAETGARLRTFRVLDFRDPSKTALEER